jgi:hypothetical protein
MPVGDYACACFLATLHWPRGRVWWLANDNIIGGVTRQGDNGD